LKYQSVAAERGQNVSVDVERIKAVREAIGDRVRLIVDCNSKFDFHHARELLQGIEPYHITCVDHPVYTQDIRLMAELRRCTSIPLAGRAVVENQWGNRDLILGGAVDIMHANVLDGGGYTECLKVAHMAEMFHLPLANGDGWLTEFHLLRERIYEVIYVRPPVARHGRLPLPDKPGMGLELNVAAVDEYTDP
jgi:L-alanine-DL-glutamate epimerase-like enolase superfamily enzyme